MDSDRYLKIGYEKKYNLKNNIKFSNEKFSNITNKIINYKNLRKKELVLKNKIKLCLSSVKARLNVMESTFPEDERKKIKERINEERHIFYPSKKSIQSNIDYSSSNKDLEDIKERLNRLMN